MNDAIIGISGALVIAVLFALFVVGIVLFVDAFGGEI